jgi:hypothetical protein
MIGHSKKRHLPVPQMHRFSAKGHTTKKDTSMPIYQVSGNFKELRCYLGLIISAVIEYQEDLSEEKCALFS